MVQSEDREVISPLQHRGRNEVSKFTLNIWQRYITFQYLGRNRVNGKLGILTSERVSEYPLPRSLAWHIRELGAARAQPLRFIVHQEEGSVFYHRAPRG